MEPPADEALADAAHLLSALATAPAPRGSSPPAPPRPSPASPAPLPAPGSLRCLDPSHEGGCLRRVPSGRVSCGAPPRHVSAFPLLTRPAQLRGAPRRGHGALVRAGGRPRAEERCGGRRDWEGRGGPRAGVRQAPRSGLTPPSPGEKLLKSLLSRTPEWRDRASRAAAAAACDALGEVKLARVMRGQDTSAALRKRDMLHLARLWGYKSNLWRCVGGGAGGRVEGYKRDGGATHARAPHTPPHAPPARAAGAARPSARPAAAARPTTRPPTCPSLGPTTPPRRRRRPPCRPAPRHCVPSRC